MLYTVDSVTKMELIINQIGRFYYQIQLNKMNISHVVRTNRVWGNLHCVHMLNSSVDIVLL